METKLRVNFIFFELEFNITRVLYELRFLLRINLFLLPAFLICYAVCYYVIGNQIAAYVDEDIMRTGRLMLETARAMRAYTTTQVAPLLEKDQAKLESCVRDATRLISTGAAATLQDAAVASKLESKRVLEASRQHLIEAAQKWSSRSVEAPFLPQTIPFYASTEMFGALREQFPDFAYKEAALNPTNLRDRTVDWEADIVNNFRDNPKLAEFPGRRSAASGEVLFLSTPIRVDDESCLACHGRADKAPPELVKLYGANNGFGWRLGDVIGAQIISVPAHVSADRAASEMKSISIWLGGAFGIFYAIVNLILFFFIGKLISEQKIV